MLKFIYLYLFCYDELERLNEIDVKFLAVSLTNVFLAFSIYNRLFSLEKKKLFQRSFTLVLIIFLQTNPKMLDAIQSHDLQINPNCPF